MHQVCVLARDGVDGGRGQLPKLVAHDALADQPINSGDAGGRRRLDGGCPDRGGRGLRLALVGGRLALKAGRFALEAGGLCAQAVGLF